MKYRPFKWLQIFAWCMLCMVGWLDATAQRKKRHSKQLSPDELSVNFISKHIGVLAADSLEGRRTGTIGEQKAIRYLQAQYEALGIASAGENKSYLQSFYVDEGKAFQQLSSCTINGVVLSPELDFFPLAWSASGNFTTKSAIALHESGDAWWVDVKNVIEENSSNPHFLLADYLKQLSKESAAKGAKAILLYNSSKNEDSLSFQQKDRSEAVAIPVIYFTKGFVNKLKITVNDAPEVQGVIGFKKVGRTGTNVIASLNNQATHTIVLGAHFDHLGFGEDDNSRYTGAAAIHNGADDNASGTAALLDLARRLKAANDKRFNYLFIHFSGEELGLYGSKYFTEHPTIDLARVTFMINMDMVGRLNDSTQSLTIGGVGTSPTWPNLLLNNNHQFTIKVDSSGTGPSDHTSFYRKDIPVLFFFTGLHTDYHKPSDDADKINYKGEVQLVNYIQQLLAKANPTEKLVFTKTKEQSMGTGRFKVSIGIMPDYTFSGTGVRADGVIDNRPAKKAGLLAGDIIVQLGDHLITSVETYMQALNRFDKGQTTQVIIKRGNELKEFNLTF